jgi:hypothetical protein
VRLFLLARNHHGNRGHALSAGALRSFRNAPIFTDTPDVRFFRLKRAGRFNFSGSVDPNETAQFSVHQQSTEIPCCSRHVGQAVEWH